MDRPVYMKRNAVMTLNNEGKEIIVTYGHYRTVMYARYISQVPPTPPRGSTLRFVADVRHEEEMILEFENHEEMLEAYSILKTKYLESTQFIQSSKLHSGRGLHTTTTENKSKSANVFFF
ncbi:unnamed protein product [Thelazia callipaeda]|uniref:DUF2129 domain-containing protein n=1 Tax=Thelazia callipaeda TaxID=103827 RepID=A0A0N5CW15_THECL|nr:unnamed protein product [Thelazia callipaeda]